MKQRTKLQTKNYKLKTDSGVAAIFAVLLMGVFLSITLTLSAIFIPKIRISSDVKSSVTALFFGDFWTPF